LKIFISYRRQDLLVAGALRGLHERLSKQFGAKNVFMDIEAIPPGCDFRIVLDESVGKADVVLALMGPQWTELQAARMALSDREDFVRAEIQTAVRLGIPVVPVLIGGATLPSARQLPAGIQCISSHQALEIDHGKRFDADVSILITELCRHHGGSAERARYTRKPGTPFWKSSSLRRLVRVTLATALLIAAAVIYHDGRIFDLLTKLRRVGAVSGLSPAFYKLELSEQYDQVPANQPLSEQQQLRLRQQVAAAHEAAEQGRSLMIDRDYEGAEDAFKRALDLLPDTDSMTEWRTACVQYYGDAVFQLATLREKEGRIVEAMALAKAVLSPLVDPGNGAAQRMIKRLEVREPDVAGLEYLANQPTEHLRNKLQRIILPSLEFHDTPLFEAVDFLRTKSFELDTSEPDASRRGVPILLDLGPLQDSSPAITLRLTDVPLAEALRYTAELAGMKYVVEPYQVKVVPPYWDESASMISRFHKFTRAEFGSARQLQSYGDPFSSTESPASPRASSTEQWMASFGISFPVGASANYDEEKELLSMHNTAAQQELLDAIIESIRVSQR